MYERWEIEDQAADLCNTRRSIRGEQRYQQQAMGMLVISWSVAVYLVIQGGWLAAVGFATAGVLFAKDVRTSRRLLRSLRQQEQQEDRFLRYMEARAAVDRRDDGLHGYEAFAAEGVPPIIGHIYSEQTLGR